MYIYTYIYIYVYVYMYTYTHIYTITPTQTPTNTHVLLGLLRDEISVHVSMEFVIHVSPSDLLKSLPVQDQDEAKLSRDGADRSQHHSCEGRGKQAFH